MAELQADNFDAGGDANPMPAPWYNARKYSSNFYYRTSQHAAPTGLDTSAQNYWDNGVIVWPDNQYSQCRVYTTGAVGSGGSSGVGFGPSVRNQNDPSYAQQYRLIVDQAASNNVCIEVRNETEGGDTITILGRATQAWSSGAMWRLEIEGYVLRAYLDGSLVLTVSDAGSTFASGYPGICYGQTEPNGYVDDWSAGSLTTVTEIQVSMQEPVAVRAIIS